MNPSHKHRLMHFSTRPWRNNWCVVGRKIYATADMRRLDTPRQRKFMKRAFWKRERMFQKRDIVES